MTAVAPPWVWEIRDQAGRVLRRGGQWTHELAAAKDVADERAAVYAYRRIRAGQAAELDGLVCRVRRWDSDEWTEVSVSVWARRAEARRR